MSIAPPALEFGIYRDGDNNLDREQAACITQALNTGMRDSSIAFVVEDTTSRRGLAPEGVLRTERYAFRDGVATDVRVGKPQDPSARGTLSDFVSETLDRAQADGAKQTWIELVDHGGGDGGGLQSDTHGSVMSERDIAGAIADGIARHAREHPEDADRRVDGVVANQCLMSTLGFADALSQTGVRYLAASPEIMLAPGTPSTVASAIAHNIDDPQRMAHDVVQTAMDYRAASEDGPYGTAAAFSVLDTSADRIATVRDAVKTLDGDLTRAVKADTATAAHVRADERSVRGMARCEPQNLPWRADRPAIALYDKLAGDTRLSDKVRADARAASTAVRSMVLAHGESTSFEPYGGISYSDAVGPTVHAPIRQSQIDPWAPQMRETANSFWKDTGAGRLADALTARGTIA